MFPAIFLVHKGKHYTVRKYLTSWGEEFGVDLSVRNYPKLRGTGRTALNRLEKAAHSWRTGIFRESIVRGEGPSIVVLSNVELLSQGETEAASELRRSLAAHPDGHVLVNHVGQAAGLDGHRPSTSRRTPHE